MSRPRVHQLSPNADDSRTAIPTPATTLTTRSMPLTSRLTGVSWTTSSAVSGAVSGADPGNSASATT